MPKPVQLRLLPPKISDETVRECQQLLESALSGELVGIAYVAISRNNYSVNAVGQASDKPTTARGMVPVLDELLRDRQRCGPKRTR
jgi:hypothetical protein